MFRAEAEALGALDDPYVVRLYEYVESAAGAAIVMELIDGVTLWDILSAHGRTTPESALVVLYGSLLGLAAAHARGVVHRDFKPRNVLVNAYGASKLTDFGIAARTGTATVPSGSVAYAPPEQFDGGPATPAADVYAATATFYECLVGRPPFTGTTMESVIWQHHSAEVPMDPVPEPLRPIVARGMAKDPRYRPADAAELAAGLRAAAASAYGRGLGAARPLAPRGGGAAPGGPVALGRGSRAPRLLRRAGPPAPRRSARARRRGGPPPGDPGRTAPLAPAARPAPGPPRAPAGRPGQNGIAGRRAPAQRGGRGHRGGGRGGRADRGGHQPRAERSGHCRPAGGRRVLRTARDHPRLAHLQPAADKRRRVRPVQRRRGRDRQAQRRDQGRRRRGGRPPLRKAVPLHERARPGRVGNPGPGWRHGGVLVLA